MTTLLHYEITACDSCEFAPLAKEQLHHLFAADVYEHAIVDVREAQPGDLTGRAAYDEFLTGRIVGWEDDETFRKWSKCVDCTHPFQITFVSL